MTIFHAVTYFIFISFSRVDNFIIPIQFTGSKLKVRAVTLLTKGHTNSRLENQYSSPDLSES